VVRAALRDEPIPIYWRGEQVRDFIYVGDLARAHASVLDLAGLQYFNVGSEQGVTVKAVLQAVTDILGRPLRIDDRGERAGDVPAYYATSARLRGATGWQAQVSLEEGLARTVAYYREVLAAGGQVEKPDTPISS
jgi:UDP-glucose 4-epimerase